MQTPINFQTEASREMFQEYNSSCNTMKTPSDRSYMKSSEDKTRYYENVVEKLKPNFHKPRNQKHQNLKLNIERDFYQSFESPKMKVEDETNKIEQQQQIEK